MKRSLVIVASSVLLGLLVVGVVAFFMIQGAEYTIYIEREQIQQAVDKKLPYEKRFALIFVLAVKNTRVFLTDGSDRIGASTDLELNVKIKDKPKNLGGFIKSETGVRYDQGNFCFYLLGPEIKELKIRGIPERYTRAVSAGTKRILEQYMSDVPVYKIKDDSLKLKLAKAVLKDVEVVNGRLVVTLGY